MKNMDEDKSKATVQQIVEVIKERPKNDKVEAKKGVDLVGLTQKLVARKKNKIK